MFEFDHVIVAVRDFDLAAERLLEEYGLGSVPGGRHATLGTGNRIVPMGDDYLEFMAIVDRDQAMQGPLGPWVDRLSTAGDRLGGLCLRTDDIEGVAERIGSQPMPMSRTTPEGVEVSWKLAGLERTLENPSYPFFIQWNVPAELHPGRMEAMHGIDPHGITWVEIATDDPSGVQRWLGGHPLDIRVSGGEPGLVAVGIETDAGEIVLA